MLNPVDDALIARLEAALPDAVRPVEPHHLEEPRAKWTGQAGVLVAPSSTEEVAEVVRLAADARTGIVPLGGGTGLVGGQVMPEGPLPVLLSLARMTRVRAVHADENVLVAEAGATLSDIHATAAEAGRLFPLSYASEGSARIGGALAVNSGGLNVLRYGTARDLCLGLEAVLPDGRILHGLRRLRKDNTGYDIRNLLIGSEGTLGIITAAALRLFAPQARRATAFLVVPGPEQAVALLSRAARVAGETVSAFEIMSGQGLHFLAETGFDLSHPFPDPPDWIILLEIATGESGDPENLVETLFTEAAEAGEVTDGHVAQSEAQREAFWAVRETIPEANRRVGAVASHDISLPLSAVAGFLEEAPRRLAALGPLRINAFGHLGDGNLHYNLFPPEGEARADWAHLAEKASETVHDLVAELDGSFSAEHGIGRLKVGDLERYGDPVKVDLMRRIKAAVDPLGIMNPGAVLRG
jgi:FAD/FMN-containing dehydrogenase